MKACPAQVALIKACSKGLISNKTAYVYKNHNTQGRRNLKMKLN